MLALEHGLVCSPCSFGQTTDQKAEWKPAPATKQKNSSETAGQGKKENKSALIVFEMIAFGFVCGLSAGYLLGRARSPKFDDPIESPVSIRQYVVNKREFEPSDHDTVRSANDCIVTRHLDGTIASIGPTGHYSFSCGVVTYVYNPSSRQLQKRPFHPATDADRARPPRNGFKFKETLALLVGGVEVTVSSPRGTVFCILASADSAKGSDNSLPMIFYACAGAVSGLVFGFWVGYVEEPKCGETLFQQLLNDVVFWEGVADAHTTAKWWRFDRDRARIHVIIGRLPLPSLESGP